MLISVFDISSARRLKAYVLNKLALIWIAFVYCSVNIWVNYSRICYSHQIRVVLLDPGSCVKYINRFWCVEIFTFNAGSECLTKQK